MKIFGGLKGILASVHVPYILYIKKAGNAGLFHE